MLMAPDLAHLEAHGVCRADGVAENRTRVRVETGGQIHRHLDRGGPGVDRGDEPADGAFERPAQSRAEERIHDPRRRREHRAAVRFILRPVERRPEVRPRVRIGARILRLGCAQPDRERRHARVAQQPRHDVTVAAIVARTAAHGDRCTGGSSGGQASLPQQALHMSRDLVPRVLHQHAAWNAQRLDGVTIHAPHLVRGA
jgi:hypothetical protein